MDLRKLHSSKVISWVRAPLEEIFFFWNLGLIGLFFTHSNTLESYAIKEGQENLKTQKFIQEMREIAITIYLCTYILPKL